MIIKLEPIPIKKIWAGEKLAKIYNIKSKNIGEIIGISGQRNMSNKISNGIFKGRNLREVFKNERIFFGNYPNEEFPILIKIISAKEDLSIQVHPNDNYANLNENSLGKDECWYILDSAINSRIQIGHLAKNRKEMNESIKNKSLSSLLVYQSIKKEDYFYIPAGKVHAICKDTTLLEVSQSSSITYRIFDYDRLENGKPRKLSIKKSLDVIFFPDKNTINEKKYFDLNIIKSSKDVLKSHVYGDYYYIIDGEGYFNNEKVSKGDFIVVTSNFEYKIIGNLKLALVRIPKV